MAEDFAQLKPLNIPQLLDRTIRLYRNHFFAFTGIVAAMIIPVTIIQFLSGLLSINANLEMLESGTFTPATVGAAGGQFLFAVLNLILVQGIGMAALATAVRNNYLGIETTIGEAYGNVGGNWGRIVGALLLGGLMAIVLLFAALIPCVGWLLGPGLVFFMSSILVRLTPVIIIVEGRGGTKAYRRAWDLTRQRFWWVVGFVVLLGLFAQLIVTGPTAIVTYVLQFFVVQPMMATDPTRALIIQQIATSLTTMVTSVFFYPIQLIAFTLMYFDLRVRTEGLDLDLRAGLEEGVTASDIAAQAPPPEQGNLLTWEDAGRFAALTVAAIAVLAVIYGALFGIFLGLMSASGLI